MNWIHIISNHMIYHHNILYDIYHLFSFCKSVQDYIIHMDMEIVIFDGIKG